MTFNLLFSATIFCLRFQTKALTYIVTIFFLLFVLKNRDIQSTSLIRIIYILELKWLKRNGCTNYMKDSSLTVMEKPFIKMDLFNRGKENKDSL